PITSLIIKHAAAGRSVVRLKGGDPLVYGRGGEEARACREAGIPVHYVPGISSALAAATSAGVPLTERGVGRTVYIAPGRDQSGGDEALASLREGAHSDTIVVLMGVTALPRVVEVLLEAGRDADTPIACVESATTRAQRTIDGTLGDIVGRAKEAELSSPATLIIGNVAAGSRRLEWTVEPGGPLVGKRIVLTGSSSTRRRMREGLRTLGATTFDIPTSRIEPIIEPAASGELDRAFLHLTGRPRRISSNRSRECEGASGAVRSLYTEHPARGEAGDIVCEVPGESAGGPDWRFDWIVFTSGAAVRCFMDRLVSDGYDVRSLGDMKIATVGRAAARALERFGIIPDCRSRRQRGRARFAGSSFCEGQRVLWPTSETMAKDSSDPIDRRGAIITVVPVHRTVDVPVRGDRRKIVESAHAVVLADASAIRGMDRAGLMQFEGIAVCLTAGALRAAGASGVARTVRPSAPSVDGILASLSAITADLNAGPKALASRGDAR
ncbi:MAG: uroporphyrinogen-III synthase, partial [Planctomycetes bacterium]|nr:uroporphyrinogen-III synthase [Planctomycetota bacterium]